MPLMLGKRPKKTDRLKRTIQFRDILVPNMPRALAAVDYSAGVQWDMLGNDVAGNCAAAMILHVIKGWLQLTGKADDITTADAIALYVAVSGREGAAYDPATGANDNGLCILDVLNFMRTDGIRGHKIGAFAEVDPRDFEHIKLAIELYRGGLCIGLMLPTTAQNQDTWDVTPETVPGSWGGHAVDGAGYGIFPVLGYDADGVTIITWGSPKRLTWAFFALCCDEAYVVWAPECLEDGKGPTGIDQAGLLQLLAAVGSNPVGQGEASPTPPPVPDAKNVFLLHLTGLGTDPAGDENGMRPLAANILPGVQIVAFAWDAQSPEMLWSAIVAKYRASGAKFFIIEDHSLGGCASLSLTQWLDAYAPDVVVDLNVLFDPVNNWLVTGPHFNLAKWDVGACVRHCLCFYQRNGLAFFITGTPIPSLPGSGRVVVDVTPWRNPVLTHIDFLWGVCLIKDDRVGSLVAAGVEAIILGGDFEAAIDARLLVVRTVNASRAEARRGMPADPTEAVIQESIARTASLNGSQLMHRVF